MSTPRAGVRAEEAKVRDERERTRANRGPYKAIYAGCSLGCRGEERGYRHILDKAVYPGNIQAVSAQRKR